MRGGVSVLVTAVLGLVPAGAGEAQLRLSEGGRTEYVIVTGAKPIPAEQTAARELAECLKKVTGAEFRTIEETAAEKPVKAIYLGWTTFAADKGIDCAELGTEEWVVRTLGNDLIVTGGRPRGTLYGVYDFLENEVGVHWLDRDVEVVPRRPTLAVAALDRRAKPAFRIRNNYPTSLNEVEMRFRVRNRQNYHGANVGDLPTSFFDSYGGREYLGGPYHCHNLGLYLPAEKHFAEHPEYYALDTKGIRVPPVGADIHRIALTGGICLTHPEVRKIILANMLDLIAADRREFPPGRTASPDQPPPTLYDVSQQDNSVVCHCPTCRTLVEREGSESAPLIDFINELADGVRERYPEIKLQTFAYMWSQIPPRTLRPRDNVVIRWCDWYATSGDQRDPEPWHPLTAPVNAWRAENLRQWSAIASAGLHVWDYGQPFAWPGFPFALAPMLAEDLRLFADNHAFAVFLQTGGTVPWLPAGDLATGNAPCHFSPLYNWLACQLMLDPRKAVEPLIDTFMAGYYGPAAPTMRALYDKLATAQRTLPSRAVSGNSILQIDYATAAFHAEIDALLQQAEAACEPDSLSLRHVQFERLRSDSALLDNWQKLRWKLAPGSAMPFDRDAVIARIEDRAGPVMTGLGYPDRTLGSLVERIQRWRSPLPTSELPERFRALPPERVRQFLHPSLMKSGIIVSDPEASGGMALRLRNTGADAHDADPVFGLYDQKLKEFGPTLTIAKADIPQDGKYHLYRVGCWRILPGTRLWGHKSWLVGCLELEYAYSPPGPDGTPNDNIWEVWVSAKFTGPAYIRGSTDQENGYYLDRVILVRPEAEGKK